MIPGDETGPPQNGDYSPTQNGDENPQNNGGEPIDANWMVDMEIALVKGFNWSLRDIDETDIESLIPFIFRFTNPQAGPDASDAKIAYCDEVNFL